MVHTKDKRHRNLLFLAAAVLLIPICLWTVLELSHRFGSRLIEAKMFRQTTATVTRKEYVKFDETNHFYIGDLGDRIEGRPGDEQGRVYYEFDNFDQIEEPMRSRLMQLEKKRISEGRPRFWFKNFNDRRWYDSVEVGDKLLVSYRPLSSGEIEVATVRKADQQVCRRPSHFIIALVEIILADHQHADSRTRDHNDSRPDAIKVFTTETPQSTEGTRRTQRYRGLSIHYPLCSLCDESCLQVALNCKLL